MIPTEKALQKLYVYFLECSIAHIGIEFLFVWQMLWFQDISSFLSILVSWAPFTNMV